MAVQFFVAAELIGHLKHEQMPESINRNRKRDNSVCFRTPYGPGLSRVRITHK